MLDDAVAAFLDSVSERAFDEPLMALIRAEGFDEVHLVHGQREFGKDVIGRRDGEQWAWQSKAGDINQTEWRGLVGQLDELRLVNLGHGAFDASAPRRPVLVTMGRLVGNAPDLYRDYNDRARARGEPELALWSRDTLLAKIAGNPDAVLRGSMDGQLLAVLGAVDGETVSMRSLEVFSRCWVAWEPERLSGLGVLEASLVAERLRAASRLDLACHLSLCFLRSGWAASAGDPLVQSGAAAAAGRLFEAYGMALWGECDERLLREKGLVGFSGFSAWVTYPIRCVRVGELIGLLALRVRGRDEDLFSEMACWLAEFVESQPGTARPIGDQYAVSLIPTVLALGQHRPALARALLRRATIWLCDQHERHMLGLAGVDASPREEIARSVGSALESVDLPRRRDSLIATVLLDLAAVHGWRDDYADIANDVLAVRLHAYVLRMTPGPDQYSRETLANRLDPNIDYVEELAAELPAAPHHLDETGRAQSQAGYSWDLLGIASALRDRHFFPALQNMARG